MHEMVLVTAILIAFVSVAGGTVWICTRLLAAREKLIAEMYGPAAIAPAHVHANTQDPAHHRIVA